MASSSAQSTPIRGKMGGPEVLYSTLSMCPVCTLVEQRELDVQKSEVLVRNNAVWLRVNCSIHQMQDTLLCSNVAWYKRIMSVGGAPKGLKEMEDLKEAVAPSAQRLPLVVEVIMYENNEYVKEEVLKTKIVSLQRLYEMSKTLFVLKLSGKLAPNLATLNEKILYAFGLLKRKEVVLVELSYERMKILSSLADSCFLHPRIYPSLKYYIRQGDEEHAQAEITDLLAIMKQYAGLKMVLSFSIQKPWPHLAPLLLLLRSPPYLGLVQLIELTLDRSPSVIVQDTKRIFQRRQDDIRDFTSSSGGTPSKYAFSKSQEKSQGKPLSGKISRATIQVEEEVHPLTLNNDDDDDDVDDPLRSVRDDRRGEDDGETTLKIDKSSNALSSNAMSSNAMSSNATSSSSTSNTMSSKTPFDSTKTFASTTSSPSSDPYASPSPSFASPSASAQAMDLFGPIEYSSLDPFELIMHLRETSMDSLSEEDFYPIGIASALEPFLEQVGVGRYSVRPSSLCGLFAAFFSTPTIPSSSVSKYLDLIKFHELMKPILPGIREKGIGFFSARAIKKALKHSTKLKKLPDLLSYLADSSKAPILNDFIDKLQFLVIHNHMDIASFDLSRRCDCAVLTLENNGLVASCTGCL